MVPACLAYLVSLSLLCLCLCCVRLPFFVTRNGLVRT